LLRQHALTPRQVDDQRVLPLRFHAPHRRTDGDQDADGTPNPHTDLYGNSFTDSDSNPIPDADGDAHANGYIDAIA